MQSVPPPLSNSAVLFHRSTPHTDAPSPYPPAEGVALRLGSASAEAFTRDARNILTGLALYADLLNLPGVLSQTHRHYARELRLLADRSTALLSRVLLPGGLTAAHGQPEAANQERTHEQAASRNEEPLCDPGTVLRRCLPLLQTQAAGVAEVVLRLPHETAPLPVSGETLERVVANLVSSAAEAMRVPFRDRTACTGARGTGTVWVTLFARDGVARLSVEGSGPGMSASVAAVFPQPEPGGALADQEGIARGKGHGWGHRIVHGLVTETGGRLAVRPRPAGGTVVTIHWPLPSASTLRMYPHQSSQSFRRAGKVVVAC